MGAWPQWRGPDGLGVSPDVALPEQWDDSAPNIKWKTQLPGRGCSSPIVSGNRVFVTTAYENHLPKVIRTISLYTASLLTIVFFLVVALTSVARFKRRSRSDTPPHHYAVGRLFGVVGTGIATVIFFGLLILMFAFPQRYDATVGDLLARTFGTYDTEHLFYIGENVAAARWLLTGAVALWGFATALYCLRAHSVWRLLGVLAFAACAVAFVVKAPYNAWKHEVVLWTRVLFIAPSAVLASWHLLGYLSIQFDRSTHRSPAGPGWLSHLQPLHNVRICWRYPHFFGPGSVSSWMLFVCLTAVATLAFVPVNLILPGLGVHRAVVCLDLETGKQLWEKVVFTAPAERIHADGSYATPTPATDGRHVVAHFGVGTACLDFDGRLIWKIKDPAYVYDTRYGAAASVLIWRDRTIILQESEENTRRRTWMAAFDTASGQLLWKVQPRMLRMTYATGLLYENGDGTDLVVASYQELFCFNAASGQLNWRHRIPMTQIVASITRVGSTFCVGGGTWGPSGLIVWTLDSAKPDDPVRELWKIERETPGCVSPLIYNNILFTLTDSGIMRAYDPLSGELHWRKRLKGKYQASPVAGDGKIYACNTNGLTTVIAAEPQLKILSQNQLRGTCRASMAVADSHLLLRTSDLLYCIAPSTPAAADEVMAIKSAP